jgi:hypothetical protein
MKNYDPKHAELQEDKKLHSIYTIVQHIFKQALVSRYPCGLNRLVLQNGAL